MEDGKPLQEVPPKQLNNSEFWSECGGRCNSFPNFGGDQKL